MGETPYSKPTADLSWAPDGTKTPPSAGRRSTGWVAAGAKPAAEVNWWWDAVDQHLDFVEGYLTRRFATTREAIEATTADDDQARVQLDTQQDWGGADVTKTTAGSITHLATDGRHVYYVSGLTLYAARADAVTAPHIRWTRDLAADGLATVEHISSDGDILAVVGDSATGGKALAVYTLPARGPILDATILDEVASLTTVVGVRADSTSTTDRVWIGDDTGAAGKLWRWTPSGGLVEVASTGTGIDTVALLDDAVVFTEGTALRRIDKASFAVTSTTDQAVSVISPTASFGAGAILWAIDDVTPRLKAVSLSGIEALSYTFDPPIGAAGEETLLAAGGGYAVTEMAAYSLDTGRPIIEWSTPFDGPIAIAGQHIWGVIAGELVARPVGLRGGEVWERLDASTTTIGRSDADLRLIRRQRRT